MNLNSAILEINKKNLLYNYNFFKKLNKETIVAVTIKANAYGLGDEKIIKYLYKNGCKNFFVATVNEGVNLRNKFKLGNIYILNGLENNKYNLFKKHYLTPIINSEEELLKILRKNIYFGIHVDTGINRLGIKYNLIDNSILNNKKIKVIISHLASADESKNSYNDLQRKRFDNLIKNVKNSNILFSLSNSHGSILSKNYLYSMIRPGIGIYGGHNFSNLKKYIKPVVKLKAKVLQIKKLNKNEYVGYNQTFKSKKIMNIAIIGIGYADGISRLLSNKGKVYYKNKKFDIIGRISMDTFTINITQNQKIIKVGDFVDIVNDNYGIDKLAKECNTISHEFLTSLSKRIKRLYV